MREPSVERSGALIFFFSNPLLTLVLSSPDQSVRSLRICRSVSALRRVRVGAGDFGITCLLNTASLVSGGDLETVVQTMEA